MKPPRYTDTHRFPNGYRKAAETDITLTFQRARQKHAENAKEVADKVATIRKASK